MLRAAILIAGTSYIAWYLERFETAVVYPFDATHVTPAASGEPRLTETRFDTADGASLVVWRHAAAAGRPTILYLPGNAGGLKDRAGRFRRLIDRGYGVVALAYRGSSGSTGQPSEAALSADAAAVAASIPARTLILYGESLGTAMAVRLAARGVGDGVVLEAPFTSILDLVAVQYPTEALDALVTQKWPSLSFIDEVRQPVLIVHGTEDRVVPVDMGRQMYAATGSTDKRMLEVPGHGHHALWTVEVQRVLYAFMDAL